MVKDNLKTLVIDGEKTFFKKDKVLNELMASFTKKEIVAFLNRAKQRKAKEIFKEIELYFLDFTGGGQEIIQTKEWVKLKKRLLRPLLPTLKRVGIRGANL